MEDKVILTTVGILPSKVSGQTQQHHLVQTPENGCIV